MPTIPRVEEAVPVALVEPSTPWDTRLQGWLQCLPWASCYRYFLYAYAPFAWLLLLILPTYPPGFSLDQCWAGVLHYGAVHHWQSGSDVVSTYGPLGYLHYTASYVRGTYLSCIVYQLLFKTVFIGLLYRLAVRLPRAESLVFLLFNTLLPMVDDDSIYLLLISYTGLLFCGATVGDRAWAFAAVVFVAVSGLIKGTFLGYGGIMLAWVVTCLLLTHRWRTAFGLLAAYGLCFLGAYVGLAGQSLGNLPASLRMSVEVVGGYSSAMSLRAPLESLAAGLLIFSLVLVRLGWLALGGAEAARQRMTLFLLLASGLFVAWKAGFTRSDYAHTPNFFVYALAIGTAGKIFFPPRESSYARRSFSSTEAVAILVPALIYWASCVQLYSGNHYPPTDRLYANISWLLAPKLQKEDLDASVAAHARLVALPRSKALVGNTTVDEFGYSQSVLLANGFNYTPAPIFHGYNAYTPKLIEMNTAFYHSNHAPDYVFFRPSPVDEHYPTMENAGVLLSLLRDYQPVFTEGSYLLLQHRPLVSLSAKPEAELLAAGELHAQDKFTLPESDGAIWCKLDLRPNLLGRVFGLLYHAPVCTLNVFTDGKPKGQTFRIAPGMAQAGFLINPIVASGRDFVQAQTDHLSPDQQVRAMTVTFEGTSSWQMQTVFAYRFYKLAPFAASAGAEGH